MSFEEFKSLVDNNTNNRRIFKHVNANRNTLKNIDENDHYAGGSSLIASVRGDYCMLLKCYLTWKLSFFLKSGFAWRYVIDYHYSFNIDENDILTKEDLSLDKIEGLDSDQTYFWVLKMFLMNNEISDIPEVFLDHKDMFLGHYITYITQWVYFSLDNVPNFRNGKTTVNDNIIKHFQVLIMFLERYDFDREKFILKHSDIQQKTLYDQLDMYLQMRNLIINQENIIDYCFNVTKDRPTFNNKPYNNFIINLSDYFEYMKLNEQITFWDLLYDINLIDYALLHTSSNVLINFAFDKIDKLKTEDGIYDFLFNDVDLDHMALSFCQITLARYPNIKQSMILYTFITKNTLCFTLFPDLTNQEIIDLIKEKINL